MEEIEEHKVNASFRNGVLPNSLVQIGTGAAPGERIAIYTRRGGLSAEIAANAKEVVQCCN